MPRLILLFGRPDLVTALALKRWLVAHDGSDEEDVLAELPGLGDGERRLDAMRRSAEAVVFLATPSSLASTQCLRELAIAEDLGKEIIVAVTSSGLEAGDERLARFAGRPVVDLTAEPLMPMEPVEIDGALQALAFNAAGLAVLAKHLARARLSPLSFPWTPPADRRGPYPGLVPFDETDAGVFFGRDCEIMAALMRLKAMRRRRGPRLLVIQGPSGAGKSSCLRAGLWPRLHRDSDFAPLAILRPSAGAGNAQNEIARAMQPFLARHGVSESPSAIAAEIARAPAAALASVVAAAAGLATEARRVSAPDAKPPAPLLAIDGAEPLLDGGSDGGFSRLLEAIADLLVRPPPGVDPYLLMTVRTAGMEPLIERTAALGLETPEIVALAPLPAAARRDAVVKPAEVYSRCVAPLHIDPALVDRLVDSAVGPDALPHLGFALARIFAEEGDGGTLTGSRLPRTGGLGAFVDLALADALRNAGSAGTPGNMRRLVVPALAAFDPVERQARAKAAGETDLIGGVRGGLAPLVDAMAAGGLLTRHDGTINVAHEALLRRPPLAGWLGEAAATPSSADSHRPAASGRQHEPGAARPHRRGGAAVSALLIGTIIALLAFINRDAIKDHVARQLIVRPSVLTSAEEVERIAAPGPQSTFTECASGCPSMIVIPAGSFTMGTSGPDAGDEAPAREVRISTPLAVSRTEIKVAEWEACLAAGGCVRPAGEQPTGGDRPVTGIDWDAARQYAAWLSRVTGKVYRLLSEAEWEYAARAGTVGRWSFGDDVAMLGEHAWFADNAGGTAQPVATRRPNAFGLFDMGGNVWEWVEDCYNASYEGAATDGTPAVGGNCSLHVVRGGSWLDVPDYLRPATRFWGTSDYQSDYIGFRVARTLESPLADAPD